MTTRIIVFSLVTLLFGTSLPVLATVGLIVPAFVPVTAGLIAAVVVGK